MRAFWTQYASVNDTSSQAKQEKEEKNQQLEPKSEKRLKLQSRVRALVSRYNTMSSPADSSVDASNPAPAAPTPPTPLSVTALHPGVVEVTELDKSALEREIEQEYDREMQRSDSWLGAKMEEDVTEPPKSPHMEPEYRALKLALSLSEGQMENKRRRMSSIDEEGAIAEGKGKGVVRVHIGSQVIHEGHSTQQEACYFTATEGFISGEEELKHKTPVGVVGNGVEGLRSDDVGTVAKPPHHAPPMASQPMVSSPLRNEQSMDEQPVMGMPTAEAELSAGQEERGFLRRKTFRSKTKEADSSSLPATAGAGTKVPSFIVIARARGTTLRTQAKTRGTDFRKRVSVVGTRAAKPVLTRFQKHDGADHVKQSRTASGADGEGEGVKIEESPTAVLAAMLATGATASPAPLVAAGIAESEGPVGLQEALAQARKEEEEALSQSGTRNGAERVAEIENIADIASGSEEKEEVKEAKPGFLRRSSLKATAIPSKVLSGITMKKTSTVSPSIPTKKNPTVHPSIPTKASPTKLQTNSEKSIPVEVDPKGTPVSQVAILAAVVAVGATYTATTTVDSVSISQVEAGVPGTDGQSLKVANENEGKEKEKEKDATGLPKNMAPPKSKSSIPTKKKSIRLIVEEPASATCVATSGAEVPPGPSTALLAAVAAIHSQNQHESAERTKSLDTTKTGSESKEKKSGLFKRSTARPVNPSIPTRKNPTRAKVEQPAVTSQTTAPPAMPTSTDTPPLDQDEGAKNSQSVELSRSGSQTKKKVKKVVKKSAVTPATSSDATTENPIHSKAAEEPVLNLPTPLTPGTELAQAPAEAAFAAYVISGAHSVTIPAAVQSPKSVAFGEGAEAQGQAETTQASATPSEVKEEDKKPAGLKNKAMRTKTKTSVPTKKKRSKVPVANSTVLAKDTTVEPIAPIADPTSVPQESINQQSRTHTHTIDSVPYSECALCGPDYSFHGRESEAATTTTTVPAEATSKDNKATNGPRPAALPLIPTILAELEAHTKSFRGLSFRKSEPSSPTVPKAVPENAENQNGGTAQTQKPIQDSNDARTSSFTRRASRIPRAVHVDQDINSPQSRSLANKTLRTKKEPVPATLENTPSNAETKNTPNTSKAVASKKKRPVNPFRNRSANQPELPMLAMALADTSTPVAGQEENTDVSATPVEDSPAVQIMEPSYNLSSRISFAQQRFFKRRSSHTTTIVPKREAPSVPQDTEAAAATPPLAEQAVTVSGEESEDSMENFKEANMKRRRTRILARRSIHPAFRSRVSTKNGSTPSPKVAQKVPMPGPDEPVTVQTARSPTESAKRRSAIFLKRGSFVWRQSADSGVDMEQPLHVFEPLPREFSVPEEEVENLTVNAVTLPEQEQVKVKEQEQQKPVLRERKPTGFLHNRTMRLAPDGKIREPTRIPPPLQDHAHDGVLSTGAAEQSPTPATVPENTDTATGTKPQKSMGTKILSGYFKNRSFRSAPIQAAPAAPPTLPPRNNPVATGGLGEDEITPVQKVDKVDPIGTTEEMEGPRVGLQYTRDPETLVAYLIPLPMPVLRSGSVDEENIPQRFLIYTPPRPHYLKPTPKPGQEKGKRNAVRRARREGKRRWGKRKMQEEVRKAKAFDGKTISLRGIHSKVTKGVVWSIRRIKTTDIIFLNRIDRKVVKDIHLIYPPTGAPSQQLRASLLTQLARTQSRAAKHSIISTILLPITLVIDTLAVIIWPFGGLLEIDAVWAYASIKGWHTCRSITGRLDSTREALGGEGEQGKERKRSRLGRFKGEKQPVRLMFEERDEARVFERYLAEMCHKIDPLRFPSAGVPPAEGEVERAVGWVPGVRKLDAAGVGDVVDLSSGSDLGLNDGVDANGQASAAREKGKQRVQGLGDDEAQRAEFREDLRATVKRGARGWSRKCERFEKKAERRAKKVAKRWPSVS